MVGVLAQKYVKDKKAELAKAAKQAEGLEMTKTKKTLSQQRREKIQKGESLGEINFLLKHYKCITVKDLKELLKNEADENALQISLEGSTDKINIENVLVPVVKDSKGKVIKNSTGSSLQFLCKAAKLYDPVALRRNVDIAKLRHNASLAPYFEDQLKLIKDTDLREFVESYIEHQPKFKMEYPTSSTGKYHPSWQNGEGGNGRHTKNVVKILQVFERAYPNLKWDELYAAAILHDMSKYSNFSDAYTNSEHPIIEAKKFKEYLKQTIESTQRTGIGYSPTWSFKRKIKFICHLIKWHDGRFNCNFANKEQIKHNYTKGLKRKMKYNEAYLLHLADMISSSKDLWSEYF